MTTLAVRNRRIPVGKVFAYFFLIAASAFVLIPFLWMISSALKPENQVFVFPPKWIPSPFMWENFVTAMTHLPFHIYLKNTLTIVGFTIIGNTLSNAIVAFGFARLRAPGKDILFILALSTIMLPGVVTMIPTFWLFKSLDWVNTLKPLIVPTFFANAPTIFLLRQFFLTIPHEMEEAAKIDGAGTLRIFWSIFLPLSKPAIATIVIFRFLDAWNDFMGPLIYLNDQKLYTLALGINFFKGEHLVQWNLLMAASVVVMLPCLLIFFFAQKYFIEGITLTGIKG
ncbi:MAG TPA: carbohydrate ABC transporter permease [Symbiobacteriaceae bacterium]|nr:carbohydrate ABC transporter permease [Symbiobacteriaceae bacterium]